MADKAEGLPVDFADPTEGNFSLTESLAVVDKGEDTNLLAQEMAECIITKGRTELQKYYPNAIYEGETTDEANSSAYPKNFPGTSYFRPSGENIRNCLKAVNKKNVIKGE